MVSSLEPFLNIFLSTNKFVVFLKFFNNLLCKKYLTALKVSNAKKVRGVGLFSVPRATCRA
jgi:hypothetical protein